MIPKALKSLLMALLTWPLIMVAAVLFAVLYPFIYMWISLSKEEEE